MLEANRYLTTCAAAILALPLAAPAAAQTPDAHRAPELPPWPQGLPAPQEAPAEGRWLTLEGVDGGAGTWLPRTRAEAVADRLRTCDVLPARSQARIDAIDFEHAEVTKAREERHRDELAHAVDVALAEDRARRLAEQPEPTAGYQFPTVVAWTVGALLAGLLAGGSAAFLLTH